MVELTLGMIPTIETRIETKSEAILPKLQSQNMVEFFFFFKSNI